MMEKKEDRKVMNDPKNMEALAAVEHASWSSWLKHMFQKIEGDMAAELEVFEPEHWEAFKEFPCVQRWMRQMTTPYDELPEKEKESDRVEVRAKLKVYHPSDEKARQAINIVMTHPHSQFVDVETDDGRSIKVGEWIQRTDGLWALRI